MAYVAAKGGEEAIQQAEKFYHFLNGKLTRDHVKYIEQQLPYLIDRVMGEGSLYAPELAALAIAQTGGDLYEAVLLLRAYRSTQPRLAYAQPIKQSELLTVRRISAAFKDIPGGQLLGPSLDYSHRLLRMDVLDNAEPALEGTFEIKSEQKAAPPNQPPVTDWQRAQNLLDPLPERDVDPAELPDLTKEPILFPPPREHRLQSLARAETGGTLALGYSIMRGYGLTHPTVNELRLAHAEVQITHPLTGAPFSVGRIRVSQCELVTEGLKSGDGKPKLGLGFAATLGWNEVKVISASMLDLEMSKGDGHPAHNEEFVLYHTEPVESSGFCIHYKLPHYVTFGSGLDALRGAIAKMEQQDAPTPPAQPVAEVAK